MNRFACIYIGPNLIEIITAQRGAARKLNIIDHALYPLEIDSEIYESGFISIHTGNILKRVLTEYLRLAQESQPERIDLVFSKEVSQAENFLFIYHRLSEIARDCQIRILTDEEEMELFCAASKLYISGIQDIEEDNLMMAEINAGTINFALTKNGIIDYTEQIPYGYQKLAELVEMITRQRTHYSKLLSEIIETKLRLAVEHIGKRRLTLVSLTTKDANVLARYFDGKKYDNAYVFSKAAIDKAYRELKELTPEQIKALYPYLSEAQTVTIQATVIVARQLINTAKTDAIILIQQSTAETVTRLQFLATKSKEIRKWINEGSYQSSVEIAQRYNVNQEHAETIERYALRIFDTLKKKFSLTGRERHFIRLACQLLDVGQYGGEDGQSQAVEEIITREEIIGLSFNERRILGRICRNVKINNYERTREIGNDFTMEEALLIAQLTAIIKIASALDQSRRQKVSKLQCSLSEDRFLIKITTSHNTQLERYYFERDAIWMERVFELKPELKVKRVKV